MPQSPLLPPPYPPGFKEPPFTLWELLPFLIISLSFLIAIAWAKFEMRRKLSAPKSPHRAPFFDEKISYERASNASKKLEVFSDIETEIRAKEAKLAKTGKIKHAVKTKNIF